MNGKIMGEPLQAQGLTAEYKEAEVRNEEIKITFSHVPKFVSLSMYYHASGYNYGYSVNIYYSKQTTIYHYADINSGNDYIDVTFSGKTMTIDHLQGKNTAYAVAFY